MLPGTSPPKTGIILPVRTNSGIVVLAVAANSILSFASCGKIYNTRKPVRIPPGAE